MISKEKSCDMIGRCKTERRDNLIDLIEQSRLGKYEEEDIIYKYILVDSSGIRDSMDVVMKEELTSHILVQS